MVSCINNCCQNNVQQLMAEMKKKMQSADTDGVKGLSKEELASIDTSNDKGGENFIKKLNENFDKIDTDKDGQLSEDEIKAARPKRGHMGPPPGLDLGKLFSEYDKDGVSGLSKDEVSSIDTQNNKHKAKFVNMLSENFEKIDTNKDGQLSQDEIKVARENERAKKAEKNGDSNSENMTQTLKTMAEQFVKQLLSAYQNNSDLFKSTVDTVG